MPVLRNDKIKLIKYLGILFLGILLVYRIPHDSYSVSRFIIRPIRFENGAIFLYSVPSLILFLIGISGIMHLRRLENRSRLLTFLLVFLLILPVMVRTIDTVRTIYYGISKAGLNSVDMEDSRLGISTVNGTGSINIELELKDYGRTGQEFGIRIYLPETLRECMGMEAYEFTGRYRTYGNRNTVDVREEIEIPYIPEDKLEYLEESQWYWEDVRYELFNEEETVKIIRRGL